MIYFIQAEDGGPVKIGYTGSSVKSRLTTLQVSSSKKLNVLAKIRGSKTFEKHLHNKFDHLRISGEWFKPEQELLNFIAELVELEISDLPREDRSIIILPTLEKQLAILGDNIRLARLRRNLPAHLLADRANISRPTLRSIERGDSSVTFGHIANVLFSLGLSQDLEKIGADDTLGRKLQDANITIKRRVRKT